MLLNTHSYFSLRYGFPVELLQQLPKTVGRLLHPADVNSSSAAMDFVRLSAKYGIRPILGIDFRNGVEQKYGVARSNEVFVNQHLSAHLLQEFPLIRRRSIGMCSLFILFTAFPFASILSNENAFMRSPSAI